MPLILVTNDDGVTSEGIHALAEAMKPLGEVLVVAPLQEASAIGHALTLRRPLRIETVRDDNAQSGVVRHWSPCACPNCMQSARAGPMW